MHAMAGSTPVAQADTTASPWTSTTRAAIALGMSATSLHRRLRYPHWVEGRHYRWINKGLRRVLQVNLTEAGLLIRRRGW
jgi:hypothetical protein